MGKHQSKINWVAVSMAVIGVLTAITETIRGREKDTAHTAVTSTQDLLISHIYEKIAKIEERLDDREDGASERWRAITDIRIQLEHVLTTLDHLTDGKRSRAKRELDSFEERFEERERPPPKEKTIRVGPSSLKRPVFDRNKVLQRQQQLYDE